MDMKWLLWRRKPKTEPKLEVPEEVVCPGCDYVYPVTGIPLGREVTVVCAVCEVQFDLVPFDGHYEAHVRAI